MDMPGLYVPNYMSFHNDNVFLGSYGKLRFKLTPNVPEEVIRAEYWFGPLCYDLSQMDGEQTFSLTHEGIEEMKAWLESLV